jgi:hypothetical protein
MSSNDKTRQKLMDSMRKTKASTDKKTASAEQKGKSQAKRDKPVKAKPKKAQKKLAEKGNAVTGGDPYQSGRRIWPD